MSLNTIFRILILVLLPTPTLSSQIVLRVRIGTTKVQLTLERYVVGVLAGESSIFRSDEAVKSMAVAARTYAVRMRGRHSSEGADFCDTTHCQRLDLEAITPRLESIAAVTAGELLWFEGKPAFTPYTRDCGGRTEDAAAVWPDQAATYLKSLNDGHRSVAWQWTVDPVRVAEALRLSQLTVPRRVDRITITQRTPSGRARTLALYGGGQTIRISAGSFRFAIGRDLGWNTVQSDRYEIREGTVFEGQGSGHGVGLCQRGADQMGAAGRTYHEILAFYYPGTVPGLSGQGLPWQRIGGDNLALLTTRVDRDRAVLPVAEEQARTVTKRTRWTFPSNVEIRAYPDIETFRNATGEPGWVAAYTVGRTIHLQPARVLRSRGVLEQTLRHEMFHVLVESQASAGQPLWFREGLVEFLDGPPIRAGVRTPDDSELRQTADESRARRAYGEAAGAVGALVRRYGETTVLDWLKTGLPAEVRNASSSHAPTKSK